MTTTEQQSKEAELRGLAFAAASNNDLTDAFPTSSPGGDLLVGADDAVSLLSGFASAGHNYNQNEREQQQREEAAAFPDPVLSPAEKLAIETKAALENSNNDDKSGPPSPTSVSRTPAAPSAAATPARAPASSTPVRPSAPANTPARPTKTSPAALLDAFGDTTASTTALINSANTSKTGPVAAKNLQPPTPPGAHAPPGAVVAYVQAKARYETLQSRLAEEQRRAREEHRAEVAKAKEEAEKAKAEAEAEKAKEGNGKSPGLKWWKKAGVGAAAGRSRSEIEAESFIEEIESVVANPTGSAVGGKAGESTDKDGGNGANAAASNAATAAVATTLGLATFEEEAMANEAAMLGDEDSPVEVTEGVEATIVESTGNVTVNPFGCCGCGKGGGLLDDCNDDDNNNGTGRFGLPTTRAEFEGLLNGLAYPSPNYQGDKSVTVGVVEGTDGKTDKQDTTTASTGLVAAAMAAAAAAAAVADFASDKKGDGGDKKEEDKVEEEKIGGSKDDGKATVEGDKLVKTTRQAESPFATGPVDVDEVSHTSLMAEDANNKKAAVSVAKSIGLFGLKNKKSKNKKEDENNKDAIKKVAPVLATIGEEVVKGKDAGAGEDNTNKSSNKVTIAAQVDEKGINDNEEANNDNNKEAAAAAATTNDYVDTSEPDPIPPRKSKADDASTVVSLQFKPPKPASITRDNSVTTAQVDNTTSGKRGAAIAGGGGGSKKNMFRSLKKALSSRKVAATSTAAASAAIAGGPAATIRMISGCADAQTSSDVQNISSFALPDPSGRASGACTSSLLQVLYDAEGSKAKSVGKKKRKGATSKLSYADVLSKMRTDLKKKGYDQTPQLTASRRVDIGTPFRLNTGKGTARALLVGINYTGEKNRLSGCHNDVRNMHRYLTEIAGFDEENVTILMDDGDCPLPSKANIIETWKELVEDSKAGDSVFFLVSGHGGKVRSEEDDGYDETICPIDYDEYGQIRDDDIYQTLYEPMAKGVTVTCLMDSCHSGTVLDLPYVFKADGSSGKKNMALNNGFYSSKFFGGTPNVTVREENDGISTSTPPRKSKDGHNATSAPSTPSTINDPISDCEEDVDAKTMMSF